MKTKRLLSMLICICMVWSIVFQTFTTYAMTESETDITDEVFVDSETEINEEDESEISEIISYESASYDSDVTYASTSDVVTYGEYDYVINTDKPLSLLKVELIKLIKGLSLC